MEEVMIMDLHVNSEGISVDSPHDTKEERKSFRCPQCKYITDRKNNLKRHIITMHQESSKSLECCGVIFKSKALLRDHVCLFHRGGYCCQLCGRNFCRKALLHRHLTVHSGQKDFSCSQCGYATSHKSNLERHQKVHYRCGESLGVEIELSPTDDNRCVANKCNPVETGTPRITKHRRLSLTHRCYLLLPQRLAQTYARTPETSTTWNIDTAMSESAKSEAIVAHKGIQNDLNGSTECSFMIPTGNIEQSDVQNECHTNNEEIDAATPTKRARCSSKRLFEHPYKCTECQNHFTVQKDLFSHKCKIREHHQPTLPVSLAFRKGNIKSEHLDFARPVYNYSLDGSEKSHSAAPTINRYDGKYKMSSSNNVSDVKSESLEAVKINRKRKMIDQSNHRNVIRSTSVNFENQYGTKKYNHSSVSINQFALQNYRNGISSIYHGRSQTDKSYSQHGKSSMDVSLLHGKGCPEFSNLTASTPTATNPTVISSTATNPTVNPLRNVLDKTVNFWRMW